MINYLPDGRPSEVDEWLYGAPNGSTYTCYGGYSHSCPALKLYGYSGPAELEAGIRRELRKREKAKERLSEHWTG